MHCLSAITEASETSQYGGQRMACEGKVLESERESSPDVLQMLRKHAECGSE